MIEVPLIGNHDPRRQELLEAVIEYRESKSRSLRIGRRALRRKMECRQLGHIAVILEPNFNGLAHEETRLRMESALHATQSPNFGV